MEREKHSVLVNADRCVGCGLCTKDCVSGAITLKDGKAAVTGEGCIFCGHCEAICPNGAVSLTGFQESSEEYEKQTRLDPEELLKAIKTRRSVRVFADAMIPDSVTDSIIEAGRLAPTGANAQNTGFIVLGSKQNDAEKMALSLFRKLMKAGKPFIPFLKDMEFDDRFFFKGAPLVIVLTGNAVNASLAAENMAFMAEAQGLGVFFSGFFTMCANHSSKIRDLLQMERKEKAVTTLVIGFPGVSYKRTVRREPARVRKL